MGHMLMLWGSYELWPLVEIYKGNTSEVAVLPSSGRLTCGHKLCLQQGFAIFGKEILSALIDLPLQVANKYFGIEYIANALHLVFHIKLSRLFQIVISAPSKSFLSSLPEARPRIFCGISLGKMKTRIVLRNQVRSWTTKMRLTAKVHYWLDVLVSDTGL